MCTYERREAAATLWYSLRSRGGESLLLGMDPGIFQSWTKAHHGEHWVHITLHSTGNKDLESFI